MSQDNDSVVLEYVLDAAPEKVWRALTIPELVSAWLPTDLPGSASYSVIAAEAPKRLSLNWRDQEEGHVLDSTVTFELEGNGDGGTLLRLVHSGLAPAMPEPANSNTPVALLAAA